MILLAGQQRWVPISSKGDFRFLPAILSLWQEQQYSAPFRVTRSRLMQASGIRSPATYHKCLKELIKEEYIIYEPSFDKHIASRVTLVTDKAGK